MVTTAASRAGRPSAGVSCAYQRSRFSAAPPPFPAPKKKRITSPSSASPAARGSRHCAARTSEGAGTRVHAVGTVKRSPTASVCTVSPASAAGARTATSRSARSMAVPRRFATPPSSFPQERGQPARRRSAAARGTPAVAPERAALAEPPDLARDGAPLLGEKAADGVREARVAEPVHARGRGRVEAAPELELAARARLEPPEPARDAVLDPRVVADVEVEMADRALGAPVAAVERVALGDVEGAGDHTAVLPRDDEHEARAHALARQREEALVQVLLPPGELRDRAAVEPEHAREEPVGDVVADVGDDLDTRGGELAPLATDLVAALAAQARQIVVEGRESRVRPVVLPARAGEPAAPLERRHLVGEAEGDVRGRELVLAARALERRGERRDDLAAVHARRGEEARTRHRREGDRDQQLRVVGNARARRGGGPVLVEDELAQAVALHVERAGPDQALALPERQEARQPAGRGGGGARVLEDREPLPLEEGRAVTDQPVPRRARDVAHRFEEAEGLHTIDSTQPPSTSMPALEPVTSARLPASRRSIAPLSELARESGSAVEEGQQRVGLRRGEREDRARDAEVPEARQPRRVHRRAVDGDRDAARVPALLARQPPELRHSRLQVAGAHADREPAVAVVDHARQRARALAAQQDGRVRLLHRLRPRPEGLEAHEAALEGRLVLGPDALHGEHALAQHAPALLEVGAVVLHLLGVPPAADAEEDAPAREEVEARDLLGGGDRVALDEETDSRADLERGGHGGRRRQRDEQVVRVPVLLRQRRPARPRAPPRDRDVGVLREPE